MAYNTFCMDLVLQLNKPDMAKYRSIITTNKFIPEEVLEVINSIEEYCTFIGADLIADWYSFSNWYNSCKVSKWNVQITALCSALALHVQSGSGDAILQAFIDKKYAEAISLEADEVYSAPPAKYHPNKGDSIQALVDAYRAESVRTNREVAVQESSSVLEALKSIKRSGLSWPLASLNIIIGPISKEFIIVASRPDGGKTTFMAHTAQHMAQQLQGDKVVLWFNNEEAIDRVKNRVVQSTLGASEADIDSDPITANHQYESIINNKIIYIEDSTSVNKIERMISKYNPGLIIIDQLYKVKGSFGSTEMEAERFRQLCEWARNIGKHVAPVIVSNQLDATAEGEKCPPMNTLYGSKTGAQGEADCIVMIGRDFHTPDKRYLYTPKNKLTGRVQMAEVLLDREVARFADI